MKPSTEPSQLNVEALDLEGIIRGLDNGDFTSQDLVDAYLERIERFNDQAYAVACINPDARAIAIQREQERVAGTILGGWSALFGQALGGFYAEQDPQGSSSGSAIALSLNMASVAIGAETCGSILYPTQRNSIVGLASRARTIPINPEQDSIGPLSRSVKDSAIILQIKAGGDKNDLATEDIPFGDRIPNYLSSCRKSGLQGVRVVVPQVVYKVANSDPEVDETFWVAVAAIKSLGATVVDDADFDIWKSSAGLREDLFGDVMLPYEVFFKTLKVNPHGINNVSDVIEFTKKELLERYSDFGAE
ncbi:hypothetical protein AK830_g8521 [Neonectria ditissima]|uniref:Amidase domain-containing protein n=1 Tax=Neonectria ditissima TaxID=78410 RepID=A0A0N8H658_9HYPO|nr:hypothetical protein AK830_g8521 [Neonectria ditissima]